MASNAALLTAGAAGILGTWGRTAADGTLKALLNALHSGKPYILPGTRSALRTSFTGIYWPVDYLLDVLVVFFWEAVDGSHPTTSAIGIYFLGQFFAVLNSIYTDAFRNGNAAKWSLSPLLWALSFQCLSLGAAGPIWAFIYLANSPLVNSTTTFASDLKPLSRASATKTLSLPLALILGYAFPAVLMALPSPSLVSNGFQQKAIAIWNIFPIWVASVQKLLEIIFSIFSGGPDSPSSPSTHLLAIRLSNTLAMCVAAATHVSFVLLAVCTQLFPAMFAKGYAAYFTPTALFVPPVAVTQVKTVGDGVRSFMMWDMTVGFTVVMGVFGYQFLCAAKARGYEVRAVVGAVLAGVSAVVIGPGATATAISWARDELLFAEGEDDGIDKENHKVQVWKY